MSAVSFQTSDGMDDTDLETNLLRLMGASHLCEANPTVRAKAEELEEATKKMTSGRSCLPTKLTQDF